jgi:prepilin-type N-terminal cleavage/methylation domain-containing protein
MSHEVWSHMMKRKYRYYLYQNNSGFTLAELIITVALASIAGALLIGFLVSNNGLFLQQSARINQNIALTNSITKINDLIRSSASVASGYPLVSPSYLSSGTQLVLAVSSIDPNGNVINTTYDYIVITADPAKSNILRELVFPNALSSRKSQNVVLSTTLSLLSFSYFDSNGNSVSPTVASKISFTVKEMQKSGYANEVSSASSQINLRNK